MRLIDADAENSKLLDFIVAHDTEIQYAIEHKDREMLEDVFSEYFKEQKTAYDVEKVTKRLKQEKFAEQETILSDIHQGFNAGIEFAIKAVKVGGANENR